MAGGLCTVGAVAYACSGNPSEWTSASPISGTQNTPLTVQTYTSGTALKRSTSGFYFRYAFPNDGLACPQEAHIDVAVTSTAYGDIGSPSSKYTRTIPSLGAHVTGQTGEACWAMDPPPPPAPQTITADMLAQPKPITVN